MAGVPTATAPLYPNIRQEIGTVLSAHASTGSIQLVARSMTNEGLLDHGGLLGLADDDHPQYTTSTELGAWAGSANITTLGTIGTGTWNGSDINTQYVTPDIYFRAHLNGTDQEDIANTTTTKINLGTEDYDVGNDFDATTNYQFTAPVAGYYDLSGQVAYKNIVADKLYRCLIICSTARDIGCYLHASHTGNLSVPASDRRYLAQGETVYLAAYHNAGVGTVDISGDAEYTYLSGYLKGT